jgi:hypothetical protein
MLTNEQIADCILSDTKAYKEDIREMIIKTLNKSPRSKIFWDAWFRGAEGKDLEDAYRGVVYTNSRLKYLAKLGIVESVNELGEYQIQRIDSPEEFAESLKLNFMPPKLDSDEEALRVFKSLTHNQLESLGNV